MSESLELLIGTYTEPGSGEGIYAATLDTGRGTVGALRLVAPVANPSWVLADPDGRRVYAVSEQPGAGQVHMFEWADGRLVRRASSSSGGGLPCHLALHAGELVVANYEDGVVTRLPLSGTGFGPALSVRHVRDDVGSQHLRGPRQRGAHAHGVFSTDTGLLATDLGCDAIFRHAGDRAQPWLQLPPGTGPRLLAGSAAQCFVVGELDNHLYSVQGGRVIARLSLLPAGAQQVASAAGHVALHPDGRRLVASNRGHDSLVMFDVADPTRPRLLGHWPSGGGHPRHFMISADGAWLVVANRDADNLVVFAIEAAQLRQVGTCAGPGSPVCVAAVT